MAWCIGRQSGRWRPRDERGVADRGGSVAASVASARRSVRIEMLLPAARAICLRCVAACETDARTAACGVAACAGAMHRGTAAASFSGLSSGPDDPRSKRAGDTRAVRTARVVRIAAHARAPGVV
ncbi:hypothetical protein WM16_16130 [Burkholderia ubonensis]|uniref:Uncharacterized protein n=1 Tax=Burkholderia ubonensis TaxID=101571 RepID=A0A108CH16_9BURK|nr:hypothetical protein WM16_16130 [Burkholderia ubonensis]